MGAHFLIGLVSWFCFGGLLVCGRNRSLPFAREGPPRSPWTAECIGDSLQQPANSWITECSMANLWRWIQTLNKCCGIFVSNTPKDSIQILTLTKRWMKSKRKILAKTETHGHRRCKEWWPKRTTRVLCAMIKAEFHFVGQMGMSLSDDELKKLCQRKQCPEGTY